MRYWMVVVSKDHIKRGVEDGFIQVSHGKEGPLKRMAVDDWIVCYSPKQSYTGKDVLQAFTAIGQVANDRIYSYKMNDDFIPFRRDISYHKCKEVSVTPLINKLDFIRNKKSWGYQFRFGVFEIGEGDFNLIKAETTGS
jgi:predicted RNA-binding protein